MAKARVLFVCVHNSARSPMAEAFLNNLGGSGERCPIFPGKSVRHHWSFDDPSSFKGNMEEIKSRTRAVRDQIRSKIQMSIQEAVH